MRSHRQPIPKRPIQVVITLLASLGLGLVSALLPQAVVQSQAAGVAITPNLPATVSGNVGSAYSLTVTASGGTAPYTFTSGGQTPPGLSLTTDAETPTQATLSGTYTQTGTYNYTLTVSDSKSTSISPSTIFTVRDTSDTSIDSTTSDGPAGQYMVGFPVWVNVSVAPGTADSGTPTGQVTVTSGNGNPTCTLTLTGGQGSCDLTFTAAGTYTLQAAYAGDTYYAASQTSAGASVTILPLSIQAKLSAGVEHTCFLGTTGQMQCWGDSQYYPAGATGTYTAISTGYYQTCGLKTDGSIQCWSDDTGITNVPAGKYIAVSAGNSFACAINRHNKVVCWGDDLTTAWTNGIPTFNVKAISAGGGHVCVLKQNDSTAYCWGSNLEGVTLPTAAMQSLAAGRRHTCGITTGGALACWGPASVSITPPASGTYTQVGSGSDYSCAVDADAHLRCWGANAPTVNQTTAYTTLSVGYLHVCARTEAAPNDLACWGPNPDGQAPRLSLTPVGFSQVLPKGDPWSQLFTPAGSHTPGYNLAVNGSLPSWLSLNEYTLTGTPDQVASHSVTLTLAEAAGSSDLPLALEPVVNTYTLGVEDASTTISITSMDASATVGSPFSVSVAITESSSQGLSGQVTISSSDPQTTCQTEVVPNPDGSGGTATCALFFGSTGTKTISASYAGNSFFHSSSSNPSDVHQISVDPLVIQPMVSVGNQFSCSVDDSGNATCWGKNDSGQTLPPSATTFQSISAGQYHACGLLPNSQIACWGWNGYGVTNPPGWYGFRAVGAGENHSCAINWYGGISCWGIADNRTSGAPTSSGFSSLSVGKTHSCAINGSGIPVCWGDNTYGQINIPWAFSTSGSALSIAAGGSFSCALNAAHQAVCWGGSTGVAPLIAAPPAGEFKSISAGYDFACGIRSDDSLACWGSNGSNQLASPAGQYSSVSAGANHACAISTAGVLSCWGNNNASQAPVLAVAKTNFGTIDQGLDFSDSLWATGGRSNHYQYQSLSALPAGLALDSSTGLVSGTAALGGNFSFDVQVTELEREPYLQSVFHVSLLVRSPVQVTITPPAEPPAAGSRVIIQMSVTETAEGTHGVAPSGSVTLTLDDNQHCTVALDGAGQASCAFFLAGSVNAKATYAGDSLFKPFTPEASDPATAITVIPFEETASLLTDANRTFLHKSDGSLACFGVGCLQSRLTGIYPHAASSESVACVIGTDGEAVCYDNAATRLSVPAGPFFGLAVGSTQVCGRRLDGSVLCWQSADPAQTQTVAGSYLSLSGAGDNFCAVTAAHGLACWGAGALTPPATGQYAAVAVADDHACALSQSGTVACWGADQDGQSTPPAGTDFTQVAVGQGFSCALDAQGAIDCWGDDSLSQASAPLGVFTALTAAEDHACGLRPGLKVTCWGKNDHGEAPQFAYQPVAVTEIPAEEYWQHLFNPSGGAKPYQAIVSSGSLPAGISLQLSQSGVVLYGTPALPQDYPFVVRWEDSSPIPVVLEIPVALRVTGADLKVSIQATHPTTALLENEFTFTYTLENQTDLAVPTARLAIDLPLNLADAQVTTGLTCSLSGQALTCPIANFAAHAQIQVAVKGVVRGPAGEPLATRASILPVTSGWTELEETDNQAQLQVVTARKVTAFQDNFGGNSLDPAWTQGSLETSPSGEQYLGRLENNVLSIQQANLPPHQAMFLEFDLYIIGGWSGMASLGVGSGTPLWSYGFQGEAEPRFQTTFCNLAGGAQSFPDAYPLGNHPCQNGAVTVNSLGYPGQPDAIYHIKVNLPHNTAGLDFQLSAENLQPGSQWGVDNLSLTLKDLVDTQTFLPLIGR